MPVDKTDPVKKNHRWQGKCFSWWIFGDFVWCLCRNRSMRMSMCHPKLIVLQSISIQIWYLCAGIRHSVMIPCHMYICRYIHEHIVLDSLLDALLSVFSCVFGCYCVLQPWSGCLYICVPISFLPFVSYLPLLTVSFPHSHSGYVCVCTVLCMYIFHQMEEMYS